MIKLSVLVPTVPNRMDTVYPRLMKDLLKQCDGHQDVELLSFFDNKKRSIGTKRQDMLNLARGEYLVFIDDDDRISPEYIKEIMDALYANPNADCVVFDCTTTYVQSNRKVLCKYGVEFEYKRWEDEWRGKPAHTMVYKSDIAKKHHYSDKDWEEDMDWVKRACQDIKNQVRIDKVLYYYDFNPPTSEINAPK